MADIITGDLTEIEELIRKLEHPEEALARVSDAMAEEALSLISEGFQTETDPYGKPWAPLKLRTGKILQGNTGGLAASWHRKRVDAKGFHIANGKSYAKYHQGGTGIYGPSGKPIVPTTKKALAFGVTVAGGRKRVSNSYVFRSVDGVPQRKMIPDPGPLPPKWSSRLRAAGKAALGAYLRT